jgi:hypothetical protein
MIKKIKAKLIRTKKGNVTDMIELIDRFLDSDCDYVEWTNYPHKNAYVCQIAVITRTKAYNKTGVKACKRKETIYLVRKDKMNDFLEEIGF